MQDRTPLCGVPGSIEAKGRHQVLQAQIRSFQICRGVVPQENEGVHINYAYDEDLMLAGIRAFREWKKTERKRGCRVHGEKDMRPAANGYQLCRICQAAHSRKNYAKNSEKIKAHKREYRRLKKAA